MRNKKFSSMIMALLIAFTSSFISCSDTSKAQEEKIKVEQQAKIEEEAKVKAEEEARIKAEEEAKAKAEEEDRIKAEEEAKAKAEEEDRIKAQEEAKAKSEAEKKTQQQTTKSSNNSSSNGINNETKVGQTVYLTATGKKYHSKAKCGNTKTSWQTDINYAKSQGYTACSKCF